MLRIFSLQEYEFITFILCKLMVRKFTKWILSCIGSIWSNILNDVLSHCNWSMAPWISNSSSHLWDCSFQKGPIFSRNSLWVYLSFWTMWAFFLLKPHVHDSITLMMCSFLGPNYSPHPTSNNIFIFVISSNNAACQFSWNFNLAQVGSLITNWHT